MALSIIQTVSERQLNRADPSLAITTATSGNILISVVANTDNNADYTQPTGWTLAEQISNGILHYGAVAWKVSDGTETSVDWTSNGTATTDHQIWVREYSGLENSPIDSVSNASSGAVLSVSTGTTIDSVVDDVEAVAFMVGDAGGNFQTGRAWTNGFTEIYSATTNPGFGIATKTITSSGTVESTFSHTDTADECCAGVIIFEITTVASVTGTFDLPDVSAYSSDTVGAPFTSASHSIEFELGDGTDTATLAGTYNPKAGWAVQEITSAVKTTGSIFEDFVGTINDTSQIYYPTADTTAVSATGIVTTDSTTDIDMQFWDESDGTWKQLTLLIASTPTSGSGGINRAIIRPIVSSIVKPMIKE